MELTDYLLISTAVILIVSFAFFSVMVAVPDVSFQASVMVSEQNDAILIIIPTSISGRRENIENVDWSWAIFRGGRKLARGDGMLPLVENIPVEINCGFGIENGDILKIWYRGLLLFKSEIVK